MYRTTNLKIAYFHYLAGCWGGLNMRLDLSWGYIHFNLTAGADTERLQCDKDFSLLAVSDTPKQKEIRETYGKFLKVLADSKSFSFSPIVIVTNHLGIIL